MILIICPMKEELEALKGKITDKKEVTINDINGVEFDTKKGKCLAILGRIGKANIGFDLGTILSKYKVERIITLGVAGSLKKEIVPLNIVVANKVCYYDVDATSSNYKLGQLPQEELYFECAKDFLDDLNKLNTTLTISKGLIITGDSFATYKNMTKELLANFDDPLAVDMESATVGQIAHRLNIPFNVIRGISDNINEDLEAQQDSFEEFLVLSSNRAAAILMHLLNEEYTTDIAEF